MKRRDYLYLSAGGAFYWSYSNNRAAIATKISFSNEDLVATENIAQSEDAKLKLKLTRFDIDTKNFRNKNTQIDKITVRNIVQNNSSKEVTIAQNVDINDDFIDDSGNSYNIPLNVESAFDGDEIDMNLEFKIKFKDDTLPVYTKNKRLILHISSGINISNPNEEEPVDIEDIHNNLEGEGTESNPYIITNDYELQSIIHDVSSNYILGLNIDMSGTEEWNSGRGFTPIGNDDDIFTGSLDGDGYKLTGLNINRPERKYAGLFGRIGGAKINNINIEDSLIIGKTFVGAIAGYARSGNMLIENIQVINGSIESTDGRAAGIASYGRSGLISKVKTDVDIEAYGSNAGGIVGYARSLNIQDAASYSNVYSDGSYVGGIVGYGRYSGTVIERVYSEGNLETDGSYVGGIAGYLRDSATLRRAFANTKINDTQYSAGLVSYFRGSNVEESYWNEDVTSEPEIGGRYRDTTIQNSVPVSDELVTGSISNTTLQLLDFGSSWRTTSNYPELTFNDPSEGYRNVSLSGEGTESDPYQIYNVYDLQEMLYDKSAHYQLMNDIDARETSEWGGGFTPVGINNDVFSGSLNGNNYVISSMYIERPSIPYAGLFGRISSAKIINLELNNVNILGRNAGGVTGYGRSGNMLIENIQVINGSIESTDGRAAGIASYGRSGLISKVKTDVDIEAYGNNAGGIVGYARSLSIQDAASYSDVYSDGSYVGGIVGYGRYSGTVIERVYSEGNLETDGSYVGGIAGYLRDSATLRRAFANTEMSDTQYSAGLVSYFRGSNVEESYWNKDITGESEIGGRYRDTTIQNSAPVEDNLVKNSISSKTLQLLDFGSSWITTNNYPELTFNDPSEDYRNVSLSGDGTELDPYQIYNVYDLQEMLYNKSAHYQLMNNIDASETVEWGGGFTPIGINNDVFSGLLNGNNYTILDLHVERPSIPYAGLFGRISSAEIMNLELNNVNILGRNAGGVTGYGRSGNMLIENIQVINGSIESTDGRAAGIASYGRSGLISKVKTDVDIEAYGNNAGGIVGYARSLNIQDAASYSNVYSDGSTMGGIVGYGRYGGTVIERVYSEGKLTTDGSYAGGIAGYLRDGATLRRAFANTEIDDTQYSSGLVSYFRGSNVEESYWNEDVTGESEIGGRYRDTTIYNSVPVSDEFVKGSVSNTTLQLLDFGSSWRTTSNYPELTLEDPSENYRTVSLDGEGTESNPYQVYDIYDLQEMLYDKSAHYQLMNNINANETSDWGGGFTPIGINNDVFSGSLNGNNYTIQDLHVEKPDISYVGLFGRISSAEIMNIELNKVNILGRNAGGITGYGRSGNMLIENIHVIGGSITSTNGRAAGIASYGRSGLISKVKTDVDIEAYGNNAGGIVGYARSLNIQDAASYSNVYSDGSTMGGIVGYGRYGGTVIERVYSEGKLETEGSYAGGIAGYLRDGSMLRRAFANTEITDAQYSAGLVSYFRGSNVEESYWNEDITGESEIGGRYRDTTIQNSAPVSDEFVKGSVSNTTLQLLDFGSSWRTTSNYPELTLEDPSENYRTVSLSGEGTESNPYQIYDVYDLQEMLYNKSAHYQLMNNIDASETSNWGGGFTPIGINNDVFSGSLNGNNYVISSMNVERPSIPHAGLFGRISSAEIMNLELNNIDILGRNAGGITGYGRSGNMLIEDIQVIGGSIESTNGRAAGIASYGRGGLISKVKTDVDIKAYGNNAGGIVGYARSLNIRDAASYSNVYSDGSTMGGIVGYGRYSGTVIERVYSEGKLETEGSYAGGIAGYLRSSASIKQGFSAANIEDRSDSGGIVGYLRDSDIPDSIYWDKEVTNHQNMVGRDRGSNSLEGISLTTSEMTGSNSLDNMTNLNNNWETTDSYPTLNQI